MVFRRDAVALAVAGLLASAGFAMADGAPVPAPVLTLQTEPAPVAAEPTAPDGLLMQGLGKLGAAKALSDYGINIYGWVEGGYTYNHRHHRTTDPILPGPFNHEQGGSDNGFGGGDRNHFMLNQVTLRAEKFVASDKWDVGGLIEVTYGTDAAGIHANGLGVGNEIRGGKGGEEESSPDDRFNPQYQFDPTQFYLDVNVPVGNGLKVRAGKFVTLMGYETIDPRNNPFYSHSYAFSAIPFTHLGVLGFYNFSDQWSVAAGVSRGWDQAFEDNNSCAIDFIGQATYKINSQWTALLNWTVGPENDRDTAHYRIALNPIVTWKATEKLSFALEGLYVYDGGANAEENGSSHAYGDVWSVNLYGSYIINDFVTANARLEKYHNFSDSFGAFGDSSDFLHRTGTDTGVPTINVYSATLGVTIRPMPKDPIGKNLMIRPEARYTYSEDHVFFQGNGHGFKDQLTFGADIVFTF